MRDDNAFSLLDQNRSPAIVKYGSRSRVSILTKGSHREGGRLRVERAAKVVARDQHQDRHVVGLRTQCCPIGGLVVGRDEDVQGTLRFATTVSVLVKSLLTMAVKLSLTDPAFAAIPAPWASADRPSAICEAAFSGTRMQCDL